MLAPAKIAQRKAAADFGQVLNQISDAGNETAQY